MKFGSANKAILHGQYFEESDMVSILTNASSMAALQTLKSVNSSVATVQNQISTGLRVSEASHNAAYWSIATTMRSDNKANSVVQDAIGLGVARTDVAYAGLSSVLDVLSDFNARLVLAKDETTNRAKIQTELDLLKQQIAGISTSATFSGANWLNTNHRDNLMELSVYKTEITSSYTRSSEGTVTVGTTDVNLIRTSLFNVGGGGALQADPRSLGDIGGLRYQNFNTAAGSGYQDYEFTGPLTFDDGDVVRFTLTLDAGAYSAGETYDVVIDKGTVNSALGISNGRISNALQMSEVMRLALDQANAPATADRVSDPFYIGLRIRSNELTGHEGSSVSITVTETFAGGAAMGLENPRVPDGNNRYAGAGFNFTGPFRVHNDVTFGFEIEVGGDDPVRITVDRAAVDAVLGTTDGIVADPSQFAAILDHALNGKGLRAASSGGQVSILVDDSMYQKAGNRSTLVLREVADNIGALPTFDLMDLDITSPAANLDNYLSGLAGMLRKVSMAASELGATKVRLDMQADFARSLSDAIDRGIGQLVDADMDRASTRLSALRTQQQLAIQSLQIANANPQSILELFR